MVLRPVEFLVLLQLDEVPSFGVVCNVSVDDGFFFEPGAIKAVVGGGKAHFLLVEDEREVAVKATPCCCVKVDREVGELLDKHADDMEGWLSGDWLDQDGDHAAAHHFCDGSHSGWYGRHYLPLIRN